MPNIYLRLPKSRCQFARHRDPNRVLQPQDPLVFSPFSTEFAVMRNSLSNAAAQLQEVNTHCFSHQQWVNMLHGKDPLGQKMVVKRDQNEPLTFDEVQHLCGLREKNKSVNDDYLCIKLPTEIEVVDTVRVVTPSWNLDKHGVHRLSELIKNDFKRSIVEWALATFDFCTSNGRIVCRPQRSVLERFMMRYGIEPTAEERDNLRRVIERWICTEQNHFKVYSCFDMQYVDDKDRVEHVDDIQWE